MAVATVPEREKNDHDDDDDKSADNVVQYDIGTVPIHRNMVIDAVHDLANRRHMIHGFIEVDVTKALLVLKRRRRRRRRHDQQQPPLSFTAFLIASLARAVALHPQVQGMLTPRGDRLVVFRDVDVATTIESTDHHDGGYDFPHIVRNAQARTVQDIGQELHDMEQHPSGTRQPQPPDQRSVGLCARLPRWMRRRILRWMMREPKRRQRLVGTVSLSSVGMFGDCEGDGIGRGGHVVGYLPCHTTGIFVGGMVQKPRVVTVVGDTFSNLEVRQHVCLTLTFDHDVVVHGSTATRFIETFVEMIESASVLLVEEEAATRSSPPYRPHASMTW